jgi:hypothetical protein
MELILNKQKRNEIFVKKEEFLEKILKIWK